jgi:hypothetical protein
MMIEWKEPCPPVVAHTARTAEGWDLAVWDDGTWDVLSPPDKSLRHAKANGRETDLYTGKRRAEFVVAALSLPLDARRCYIGTTPKS